MELRNGQEINSAIGQIPIATEQEVYVGDTRADRYKAVVVEGNVIAIPSIHYKLIQHSEAFRPVIEGLTLRGVDKFKFSLMVNHKRAWMNIFVGEGYDTVKFGFRVTNSIDGTTAVKYGLSSFRETRVLELVGYRQICSNGMIVRVHLDNAEFVREEERIAIDELLTKKMSVRHSGDVTQKLEDIQYTVEAFLLLKNPLQRIIQKAEDMKLHLVEAEEIIEKYVGKRKKDKILEQYGKEEQTLWGLYNAMTFLASHKESIKATKYNTSMIQASNMLEQELQILV